MGALFARRFGWVFVELDEIKRQRGDMLVADPGAFVVAGREAKRALDTGQDVIAEEFFVNEDWIRLFLDPTALTTDSPDLTAVWLDCEVEQAVRRKKPQGTIPEGPVRRAHALVPSRFVVHDEIVLDTTNLTPEQVVTQMAGRLTARGLALRDHQEDE